tara:strand:- start:217 stop:588 length:372 start_codon:yes stop_codon:yes gene_type:complete
LRCAIAGIAESASIAVFTTILEASGLLFILYVTVPSMKQLPARVAELTPSFEPSSWIGLFGEAFLVFYAYVGFEGMVNLAEKLKAPKRTLPIAILTALEMATAIYLLPTLTSLLILSPEQLQN